MRAFICTLRILFKVAIIAAGAVVVLMLCGVALQVIVPVAVLLGLLFMLKGAWRLSTPRERRGMTN